MLFISCSQLKSSSVSVVFDFNASLNDVAPVSPIKFSIFIKSTDNSGLLMNAICVQFLLYLLIKLRWVSVVLDFNTSLSDVAPLIPMLFPVDLMRMEKSGLLMYSICVCLYSLLKSSSMSVVFDLSASLIDVAPVSPIQLPVDLMRMENSGLLIDAICVLFFCLHTRD